MRMLKEIFVARYSRCPCACPVHLLDQNSQCFAALAPPDCHYLSRTYATAMFW